jgi:hypothetical protein
MNAKEFAETLERAVEFMYQQQAEIAELKNARDYWCLQYKDVFNKLEAQQND